MGFASVQDDPLSMSIWLKRDLERVKNVAYLDCSKEESSSADVYRNGEKEEGKPFDFLTSGSGSDSLINCPRSLTRPNVIFLKRGGVKEPHRLPRELQHYGKLPVRKTKKPPK